jgi:hypothetical protein
MASIRKPVAKKSSDSTKRGNLTPERAFFARRGSTMSGEIAFGPFLNVPRELIKCAGFGCRVCHKPVECFLQTVPYLVPRMVFHACRCGTVVTWEDENQPGRKEWRHLVRMMQKSGANVLMFNGDKPLSESFTGLN